MSHRFPKRRLRANEPADPRVFNELFQPAAAVLAGRLNEHNVSTEVKGNLTIADEAYYDAHLFADESDPDFVDAGAAGNPYATIGGDGASAASSPVLDSTGWQAISSLSGSITCGEGDTLVMFGMLQHFAWKGTGPTDVALVTAPLKLQYAFEIDGTVLENSITGAYVWPDPPPQQWYRATPATNIALVPEFDYRHIQYLQNTLGISHAAGGHRLIYTTQAPSGSHNVAIKARRLPMSDYKVDSGGSGTTVEVFNRQFFILRIKGQTQRTDSASSLTVQVFEDGDVLDAADLTTNGFDALAAEVNALDSGNLARGALRNEHLESVVYGPAATGITPSGPAATFTGEYPGYATDAAAWVVVNDGLGTDLAITGPTAGEWDFAANPGTFIVLANVQVNYIKWTGASAPSNEPGALGILALRITNAAAGTSIIGITEVATNGHSFDNEASADSADLDIDVPLMWVVDTSTLSAANKHITKVEVVACVWDGFAGTSPPDVEMSTQRGLICGFALKGVTP